MVASLGIRCLCAIQSGDLSTGSEVHEKPRQAASSPLVFYMEV